MVPEQAGPVTPAFGHPGGGRNAPNQTRRERSVAAAHEEFHVSSKDAGSGSQVVSGGVSTRRVSAPSARPRRSERERPSPEPRVLPRARRRFARRGLMALAALCFAFALGVVAGRQGADALRSSPMDLARASQPGGKVELEYVGSGAVAVATRSVRIEDVPAVCLVTARNSAPGSEVTGARVQVIRGVPYFEVDVVRDALAKEILTTADGEVVGEEEQIRPEDAPAGVLACAHGAVPSGVIVSVERVWGPQAIGEPEFHVKKNVDGDILRVRVTRGAAVEVLRIVPAVIKVPVTNGR